MPRTGGVYLAPAGTKGSPNTTIQSSKYNALVDDLVLDANAARPITAGGTGATNATAARTNLGLEIGTNVQAYDAGLQSIAGLTTAADRMIYTTAADAYATTALTPFARTILDDIDAAAVRGTIGADNASNLIAGTIADARLPTTMAGKTFTGGTTMITSVAGAATAYTQFDGAGMEMFWGSGPYIDFKNAAGDDYDCRIQQTGANALTISAAGGVTFTGSATFSGSATAVGGIVANGIASTNSSQYIQGNGNRNLYFQAAGGGATRGVIYQADSTGAMITSVYNTSGAWACDLALYPDGNLYWNGVLNNGSAKWFNDGNIYMPLYGDYLSNVLNSKITTNGRAYPRLIGGGDLNMNWSGQAGQPSWLWGGNDGINMFVYNPSNFNVNNANSVGGVGINDIARVNKTDWGEETNFPIGHTIIYTATGFVNRNATTAIAHHNSDGRSYVQNNHPNAGSTLAGTWRVRGMFTGNGGVVSYMAERVA